MKILHSIWAVLLLMICSTAFVACGSDDDDAPSNLVGDWHGYSEKRSVYVTFNSNGTGTMEMTWEGTTYKEARATFSYSVNGNEIVCNGTIAEGSTTGDFTNEAFTTTFYLNGNILSGGKYTDIGSYYRLDGGESDGSNSGSTYKVSKIKYNQDKTKLFTYENEKLSTVYIQDGTQQTNVIFDYDKKTISELGQNNSYSRNWSFTLNSNGYMTQLVNKSDNKTYSFIYDSEGYLTEMKVNLGGNSTGTSTISWNNGNLTNYTYKISQSGSTTTIKYTFSYDRQQPNAGFSVFSLISAGNLIDDMFHYSGLLGKPSKNIPSTYSHSLDGNGYSNIAIRANYDKNGLPTSVSNENTDFTLEYQTKN